METAAQVNAASAVHYLRLRDIPELGLEQPRDLCLLLHKVFQLDGSYRVAMRSVVSRPSFSP